MLFRSSDLWAAFAIPREVEGPVPASGGRRLVTAATFACFAVVAVAWASTAVADVAYLSARTSIQSGRVEEAVPRLEMARRLDPGMALYARQLGTAQLLNHDVFSAVQSLDVATHLNPSDDLAWRTLALAHAASGNGGSAWAALGRALETQRSDPTNLLLTAMWQAHDGSDDEAVTTLGEILQAWPEMVAATGWRGLLPEGITTLEVVEVALDRWEQDLPSPVSESTQHLLLAVMAGRSELAEDSARESLGSAVGAAYLAIMGCEPGASVYLDEASNSARRSSLYWSLVLRQSLLDGHMDSRAQRLIEIMIDASLPSKPIDVALNPLDENGPGGFSADIWGYRREPITWPDYDQLPSDKAGALRWLLEPREAVLSAELDTVLPGCE